MPETDYAAPVTRGEFQIAIEGLRHEIALLRSETKADLANVRAELADLKAELIKWNVGTLIALSAIMSAIRFLT